MFYIQKRFRNNVLLTLVGIDKQEGGDWPVWRQYNGPVHNIKNVLLFEDYDSFCYSDLDMWNIFDKGVVLKVEV